MFKSLPKNVQISVAKIAAFLVLPKFYPKSVIRKNHLQNVNFKVPIIDEIGFQNLHLFRLWMISPTKS